MRPTLHARLVNDPFEDAGLYIQFRLAPRAIMFDLGDIHALSAREVLKLTHIFVSHTHIDHFAGFDRLLRIVLGRARTLHLYGPSGFIANVAGKLAGYTWNLLQPHDNPLILHTIEVHPTHLWRQTFASRNRFIPETAPQTEAFRTCLLTEPAFEVNCAILDHQIPSLAFSLQERFHVNIMPNRLAELNLRPGPWLASFKTALYQQHDPASRFSIPSEYCRGRPAPDTLGALTRAIARISPGQKISYVTDAAGHTANREKIVALVRHSDQLFIESAFLSQHRSLAHATAHLTARQAGKIAACAQVKQLIPFHFSTRYTGTEALLLKEAMEAFEAPDV